MVARHGFTERSTHAAERETPRTLRDPTSEFQCGDVHFSNPNDRSSGTSETHIRLRGHVRVIEFAWWGNVSLMAAKSEDLRREALGLSEVERADLAAELLASLETPIDEDPSGVRSLWGVEIERRARRVIAGEANGEDWKIVRQRLVDALGE